MVDYDAIGDDNPSIARSYFTPEGSIVIMCDITISFVKSRGRFAKQ